MRPVPGANPSARYEPDGGHIPLLINRRPAYPPGMNSTMNTRTRALIWWGAAALSLLGGYVDLWRGGETIAPILLILGYVVLVPTAILKG